MEMNSHSCSYHLATSFSPPDFFVWCSTTAHHSAELAGNTGVPAATVACAAERDTYDGWRATGSVTMEYLYTVRRKFTKLDHRSYENMFSSDSCAWHCHSNITSQLSTVHMSTLCNSAQISHMSVRMSRDTHSANKSMKLHTADRQSAHSFSKKGSSACGCECDGTNALCCVP